MRKLRVSLIAFTLLSSALFGQAAPLGTILGTVTDNSGALRNGTPTFVEVKL